VYNVIYRCETELFSISKHHHLITSYNQVIEFLVIHANARSCWLTLGAMLGDVCCTSEGQAPTSLLLTVTGTEKKILPVGVASHTEIQPHMSSLSSWATTANKCACGVLDEHAQSMSAHAQYWSCRQNPAG